IFYNAGTAGSGITVNIGSSVTSIPDYLFHVNHTSYTPKVTTLNIGENVTSIGKYAFSNITGITSIIIPASVTSIGEYAFSGLTGLTSITIPEKVTSIGSSAFSGCTALTEINYNTTNLATALTDASNIFYKAGTAGSGITVNIGSSVTSIPDYLFWDNVANSCPNVTTLNIGQNVISIGSYAFGGLTALTSITIPASITSIGDQAFYDCTNLATVHNYSALDIVAGATTHGYVAYYASNVYKYEGNVVYQITETEKIAVSATSQDVTSITLAEDCTSVAANAFQNITTLSSVTIPASVTLISDQAFYGCTNLATVYNNSELDIVVGETTHGYVAYYASIVYKNGQMASQFVTEGNVVYKVTPTEKIALRAVSQDVTTITLAEDCTSINDQAFKDCTALTEINYNTTNLATAPTSSSWIFNNAGTAGEGITVNIGSSVTSIPTYLFYIQPFSSGYTPNVTTLNIGENVTSIGQSAFDGLRGLTSITIPENVTSIGQSAFWNLTALTEINYNAKELTTAPT
ncbi:MAG: leucine-rich repeat domain-containing protein, partial [Clostridia bacterium]|nr:leucine-rich repeat domain-containing protein [Clostridia bacterium]